MIWTNGIIKNDHLLSYPSLGKDECLYEVVRVIDGFPVFLTEHLNRLSLGQQKTATPIQFSEDELIRGLLDLIRQSNNTIGNVRIQIHRITGEVKMGFIPHHYPSDADYVQGITVHTLFQERTHPEVKLWNPVVRKAADELIQKTGCYEVILVDQQHRMTEGSRSNFFAVRNNQVITPPVYQVLPGITRQVLFTIAKAHQIGLVESDVYLDELNSFESIVITGTSPGMLPVRQVDQWPFNPNHQLVKELQKHYHTAVQQNIQEAAQKFN